MSNKTNKHISSAERKTGFIAFRYYALGLLLAGIYVTFISIASLYLNLTVEKKHQIEFLGAVVGFLMLYIFSIHKYGIIRLPNIMRIGFILLAVGFFTFCIFSINLNNTGGWVSLWSVFFITIMPFPIFIFKSIVFIGTEAFKEIRFYERLTKSFSGRPSGRWGGFISHWRYDITRVFTRSVGRKIRKTKRSPILIGKTIMEYDYKILGRYIGTSSEQHLITVAGSGAGKTHTMANNVLSSYCGGIVAFDSKGEHTKHSYERRAAYAPCYVLDPFKITGKPLSRWNPLSEIDPESDYARSDLILIVESLVLREKSDEKPHFVEVPRIVIRGFMAHILTTYPKEKQNLTSVYELVAEVSAADDNARAIIDDMKKNEAIGCCARDAATELLKFSDRSGADHWATITRSLDWLGDPTMKAMLSGHDFSFSECKTKDATVFFALPAERINNFFRFVRLFFSMAFVRLNENTTPQPKGSDRRVLFILDEFHSLGEFSLIEHAFNIGRSSHLKMWVVLQNIGQLTQVYDNASNFLSNADLQAFGITSTDNEAKKLFSESLGNYIDESRPEREVETRKPKQLMSENDISDFLDPEQYNQIFLPFKGLPLRLRRVKTLKENILSKIFKAIFSKIFKTIVRILKGLITGLKNFGIGLVCVIALPCMGMSWVMDWLHSILECFIPSAILHLILWLLCVGFIFWMIIRMLT